MRQAFTLIEQLAALVLASLLMFAALAVLAGMARQGGAVPVARTEQNVALERTAELIRRDLLDAKRVKVGDNEMTLSGFNSLDPTTLAPTHRPVRVSYWIERDEHLSRLMRRQETLDVLSNHNAWSETVCNDVAAITLIPLTASPAPRLSGQPNYGLFTLADGREIPSCMRLVLTPISGAQTPFDRTLCLR